MMPPKETEHTRFFYQEEGAAEFPRKYMVQVADRQFTFKTPQFMQGFMTGALWAGVDHHKYWQDLTTLDKNGQKIKLAI